MSFFNAIQKEYDQLWKYIIRPGKTTYNKSALGPKTFHIGKYDIKRIDYKFVNSRGHKFNASLWLPQCEQKVPCVVYLHGNSSNRTEGMEYLIKLLKCRIALCTFDFSGCGNAQGEYISLGFYQKKELKIIIRRLKKQPSIGNIAIWGRSMGAVTALLYLPIDPDISAVIIDSPFKNLKSLVEDMAAKTSKIPNFILSAALKIIGKTIKQKANFDIFDVNPLKFGAPYIYIPGMFIVAIDDEIIPWKHTADVFDAYAADDKFIRMVQGKHNDDRPQQCINDIIEFLAGKLAQEKKQLIKIMKKEQEEQVEQSQQVELEPQQCQIVKEALEKQKFTWSNLFGVFNKTKKTENKLISIQQLKSTTIQEYQSNQQKIVEPFILKKEEVKNQQQKMLKKQNIKNIITSNKSQNAQLGLEQKMREYSYSYM